MEWEAILRGTEVINSGGLLMSLSLSELTIHICEMGSEGHWDLHRQDLWKDSSLQMPSRAS